MHPLLARPAKRVKVSGTIFDDVAVAVRPPSSVSSFLLAMML
jgi:hypothetical protein